MAHFQNQHTATTQSTDEYGNPKLSGTDQYGNPNVRQSDEFGNPINSAGGTTGFEGTGQPYAATGLNTGTAGHRDTKLNRSGSSSSSSSEDDGEGGRRKKGLKEKIKEKLPGTHTAPATGYGEVHEKKGIVDKIKDKLPGHHDHP